MKALPMKLINILIATVLLASPFVVGLTSSAVEYDPWADYNGDGKVDIRDIASTAIAFGSLGDPNRNVTISYANVAGTEYWTDLAPGECWTVWILTRGYRKISLGFDAQYSASEYVEVRILWYVGGWLYEWDNFWLYSSDQLRMYDVNGQNIKIELCAYTGNTVLVSGALDYYITA